MLLGQRGGGEGVSSTSYKIFANSFRLAHIIKAPCVQEVCHKSPGSAITSEDLAVAVGGADDGDGDSSGSGSGGGGGGGGSDGGAYNSSAPGPVRNGLASSREKLCECSLSLYTKNGGGSCPRAYPKAEVSRLGWPLHFARVRKGGSKIYIDDDA